QGLKTLEQALSSFDEDTLNRKTSNGGWSAIQCMHHLILSEEGSLAYVKKKLSFSPQLPNKNLGSSLRSQLLVGYLKSPIKRKAPSYISGDALPQRASLADTMKRWNNGRQDLQAFLQELDPKWYNKQVYKHPFSGRISIDNMLAFFLAHFQRHRKQALRAVG
ncbi:MAG: DinB family protein, partial [Bacteroidota bacterium]